MTGPTARDEALSGEEIIALARENSDRARRELFQVIEELMRGRRGLLNDRERFLAGEILRNLIRQFERDIRRALADRLAERDDVPPEMIVELANDEIEVAYPVLVKSRLLDDAALIEVILHRTRDHQLAIALRGQVSEAVSEALVDTGETNVIETLLANPDARISRETAAFLAEKAAQRDTFRLPLLLRRDLDPALHDRLLGLVSAALADYLSRRLAMPRLSVEVAVAESAALNAVPENAAKGRAGTRLAERLVRDRLATPELLLGVLRGGEVELFQLVLAEKTGLRLRLVQRFCHEAGLEGLAVLFRALRMSRDHFSAAFMLIRAGRNAERVVPPGALERALRYFDRLSPDGCAEVLAWWRLDEGYLGALRALENVEP